MVKSFKTITRVKYILRLYETAVLNCNNISHDPRLVAYESSVDLLCKRWMQWMHKHTSHSKTDSQSSWWDVMMNGRSHIICSKSSCCVKIWSKYESAQNIIQTQLSLFSQTHRKKCKRGEIYVWDIFEMAYCILFLKLICCAQFIY